MSTSIPVNPHLVDRTVNAEKSTVKLSVHASPIIVEARQHVVQNVSLAQNAPTTRPASTKNVKTHAQELVERMLNVTFAIIVHSVYAKLVLPGMRSPDASQFHHVRIPLYLLQ